MRNFTYLTMLSLLLLFSATQAFADPPPPPMIPTGCDPVQCFFVDTTASTISYTPGDTTVISFCVLNWYDSLPNLITEVVFQLSIPMESQMTLVGSCPPPGWTSSLVGTDSIIYQMDTSMGGGPIAEGFLCDTCATMALGSCGNMLCGFEIKVLFVDSADAITLNWSHLQNGFDNGDVMNFGALSWTFGSIIEQYSNAPFHPGYFANNGLPDSDLDGIADVVDNCPMDYNPDQLDLNDNNMGDACEAVGITGSILGDIQVRFWPNPAIDVLNLQFNEYREGTLRISVINLTGATVLPGVPLKPEPDMTVKVDIRDLPAGIYFIKVDADSGSRLEKFIKY